MNLDMNEALDLFRRWRDLQSRLLLTETAVDKVLNWLCGIAEVSETVVVRRFGSTEELKLDLRGAEFAYADAREAFDPERARKAFVCELECVWPNATVRRFRELEEDFDPIITDMT